MKAEGVLSYESGGQKDNGSFVEFYTRSQGTQGTTKHFTLDKDRQS